MEPSVAQSAPVKRVYLPAEIRAAKQKLYGGYTETKCADTWNSCKWIGAQVDKAREFYRRNFTKFGSYTSQLADAVAKNALNSPKTQAVLNDLVKFAASKATPREDLVSKWNNQALLLYTASAEVIEKLGSRTGSAQLRQNFLERVIQYQTAGVTNDHILEIDALLEGLNPFAIHDQVDDVKEKTSIALGRQFSPQDLLELTAEDSNPRTAEQIQKHILDKLDALVKSSKEPITLDTVKHLLGSDFEYIAEEWTDKLVISLEAMRTADADLKAKNERIETFQKKKQVAEKEWKQARNALEAHENPKDPAEIEPKHFENSYPRWCDKPHR